MIGGSLIGQNPERENPQPPAIPVTTSLETWVHSTSRDDLLRAAADPSLNEDLTLVLLQRADLPGEVLEQLSKNGNAVKMRRVKVALASHPHAPRHVSIPLIRQFYTFDLMRVALTPGIPADVKVAADESLISRVKTITLGERLALARQASAKIAGALLLDGEPRVMQTALDNSRLTEASVIKAVLRPEAGAALVQAVSHHRNWCHRRELRIAMLRTAHLSLARAIEYSREISPPLLREILNTSRLPARIKEHILRETQSTASF
jgi:hypothetical protein